MMMSSLPGEIAAISYVLGVISASTNLITPFISWVLCAAVFYAISMLFKGEGSFNRVFEFVGYGFIPSIIASVVGLATVTIMTPAAGFPFDNPELMQQTMMQHLSSGSPAMMVSTITQILLVIWSVVIWVVGVKHARNLGTGHAIITVLAVPAAFFLIWVIALIFIISVA